MMSVGPAKIALTEFDGRAVQCEAFTDRLAMVLAIIDNGGIQRGGFGYGSDEHLAALDEIERQIVVVREKIRDCRERDEGAETSGARDE